jgi:hypothetical protein
MQTRHLMSGLAVFVATVSIVAAQTQAPAPQQQPGQQPTTQQPDRAQPPAAPRQPAGQEPSTAQKPATITLAGCLLREQDVPGRKPNPAERAGVLEDYILTEAKAAASGSPSAPAPTGTTGSASASISSMYKVEGIADEKLKAMVGKRVEVTGRVDADDKRETKPSSGAAGSATPRSSDADMPEFEATSIRELPGNCAPSSR